MGILEDIQERILEDKQVHSIAVGSTYNRTEAPNCNVYGKCILDIAHNLLRNSILGIDGNVFHNSIVVHNGSIELGNID